MRDVGDPARGRAARSASSPSLLLGALGDRRSRSSSPARCRSPPSTPAPLLVPGLARDRAHRLPPADHAAQGDHARCVGYLVLENGIFIFGLLLLEAMPFLVEVGVLLDLFVGIFVMGIIINHINREFSSLDTRAADRAARNERWRSLLDRRSRSRWRRSPFAVPSDALAALAAAGGGAGAPGARRSRRCSRRTRRRARRLAGARPARPRRPARLRQRALPRLRALRARLPALPRRSAPNRVFCACLLAFLGDDDAWSRWSHHLGLMWVAIEATTLATRAAASTSTARRARIEATWKYLLIGSVGIALALLGSFFLAYSSLHGGARAVAAVRRPACADAPQLSQPWLHAGVRAAARRLRHEDGPGADAHLEARRLRRGARASSARSSPAASPAAPSSALLRVYQHLRRGRRGRLRARAPARHRARSRWRSPASSWSRQRDFKRMLAYSSVEHMGILVARHRHRRRRRSSARCCTCVNNGLTKGVLFLSAGNIHRAYGSKTHRRRARARCAALPLSGALFLAGFFAITGSPPFGPFVSEFTILQRAPSTPGSFVVGGALPRPAAASSSSAWARPSLARRAGPRRRRAPRRPRYRDGLADRRAGRSCCWRSCCCSASTSRAPLRALLAATRPRFWRCGR